jgi:WD40 repeat protein
VLPVPELMDAASGHENLVARALVRILDKSGDHFGFGLLVAEGRVVTCAHVVAGSMEEPDELPAPPSRGRVRLEFPFVAPGQVLTAVASAWLAMAADGSGDVAGLILDDEVPDGARPLAMTRGGNLRGHAILAYGYQAGLTGGVPAWVPGTIVDRTERGWLQLGIGEDAGGLRIRAGFSGTPVWDAQIGQVVGLVVRASISRNVRLAFAVSGETVFDAWPDLRKSFLRACPFRSLMPFQASDGNLFFGRDELAADAVDVITRSDCTVVSGPSGAGKTSLMNAAVIPQLERQGHTVITIRPLARDSLWEALAAALAESYLPAPGTPPSGASSDRQRTEMQLKESFAGETVQSRVRRLCDCLGSDRVVVVVDQFEEVLREGTGRARAFSWDLGQLPSVRHPEGRAFARIVMVVREDDEVQLQSLPPFDSDAISALHVGALSAAQLRAAVEEPVRRSGFARYEEKLPERIIDEVRVQPYSLPTLQVVLTELWERQGPDGLLRHSVYQELNRGAGPLATHLERLWHQLIPADRDAARRVFLHLVMPVGESGFARRTASQAEVNPGDWPVAGTLATQRLVVLRGSPSGGAVAELVHDSLIEQWPTLADHLSAHRDFLQWRDDLRRRISAWQQSGSQPNQLLTGAALKRGLAQQDALPGQVSEQEREFLLLSRTRVRRLRRRAFLSVTTVLTLIAALAVFAVTQRQNASQNASVALSRNLASTAAQLRGGNPQLAALLSVAAFRVSDTSEAQISLAQQLGGLQHIDRFLNVNTGMVRGVAFVPGGRTLITCGFEGANPQKLAKAKSVSFWDTSTGTQVAALSGGDCENIALSPDGHTLAELTSTGSSGGNSPGTKVILWGLPQRTELATIPGGTGPIAFSPDGRLLAIGGVQYGKVAIWDVATRAQVGTLAVPVGPGQPPEAAGVAGIAFSPDGRFLATDSTLTPAPPAVGSITLVWNLAQHKIIARLQGGHSFRGIFCLAFSPDGQVVAAGTHDANIVLYSVASGNPLAVLQADGDVHSVAFSPDGRTLVSGDGGGHVIVWDIASHARRFTWTGDTAAVDSVAISPDGRTVASGGDDGKVVLWDLAGYNHLALATLPQAAGPAVFSADERTLVAAGTSGSAIWDISRRIKLASLPAKTTPIGFAAGGRTVVLIGAGGHLVLWNVAQDRETVSSVLPGATIAGATTVAALSPDGKTLAYGTNGSGEVVLWDLQHQAEIATLASHQPGVNSLAFSPSGGTLALGTTNQITLWNVSQHSVTATLPGENPSGGVLSVALSSDGRTLASTALEGSQTGLGCAACYVILWDLRNRTQLATLGGFTANEPNSLAFSPDGRLLASGTGSEVILWSVPQRTSIATLHVPGPVSFSPDGRMLATSSQWDPRLIMGTGITLWDVGSADWATQLCQIAGRDLTRAEWATYVPGSAYQQICPGE